MAFVKIRFSSVRNGATAGLVIPIEQAAKASLAELSRLYPDTEAPKMEKLDVSPAYATQEAALEHEFAMPAGEAYQCA